MMVQLIVIFGLLAAAGAVMIYGTLAKKRWGINFSGVSCPRCGTSLPKVRQAQSLRLEMWGGWVCPSCGAEVDKWGRELHGGGDAGPEPPDSTLNTEQARQPVVTKFFERFKGRSRVFWAILLLLLVLDICYDYYSPRAIVFDVIAVAALLIWYRRSRRLTARR